MGRAKFVVMDKSEDGTRVRLIPVTSGSEENRSFYQFTPGGEIDLQILNPKASAEFVKGAEYYIDFTPAN